jgi:uncharacterized protein YhfF
LIEKFCPYGKPGDFLWVRETFWEVDGYYFYRADDHEDFKRWKASIHMPRKASRITLKITDIKVKRLKNISLQDIRAEGITNGNNMFEEFHKLWDSINAKRGYSWESDPWVWIIEFERVEDG